VPTFPDFPELPEVEDETETTPVKEDKSKKSRWDLLPFSALELAAEVMARGCGIHRNNDGWKEVPIDSHFASLMRHISAWRRGDKYDNVTGLHHMSHAACRVLFILALELEQK
jgi:hypothetical protein